MTAEDLFVLPDDDFRYELAAGEFIRMTPTGAELAVEVVSPSDRQSDVHAKFNFSAGTRLVWLVEPAHDASTSIGRRTTRTRSAATASLEAATCCLGSGARCGTFSPGMFGAEASAE